MYRLLLVLSLTFAAFAEDFPTLKGPQTIGAFRQIDPRLVEAKRNLFMQADGLLYASEPAGPETPHIPYARPLAGPPVRILYLMNPMRGHREIIELRQRLECEISVLFVPIPEFWQRYHAATEVAAEEITRRLRKTDADVIVCNDAQDIAACLPDAAVAALRAKVEAGTGFVMLHTRTGEPYRDAVLPLMTLLPGKFLFNTDASTAALAEHAVTRGVAWDQVLAPGYLQCELAPGAEAVMTLGDDPLAAVGTCGKGRLVGLAGVGTFGRGAGMPEQNGRYDRYWEQLFALRVRAVLWVAGRLQPPGPSILVRTPQPYGGKLVPNASGAEITVYDDESQPEEQPGRAGRKLVVMRILNADGEVTDWACDGVRITAPGESTFTVEPRTVQPGDMVTFATEGWFPEGGSLRVRVRDPWGRLIAEQASTGNRISWPLANPRGILFRVVADLLDAAGKVVVRHRGFFTCPTYGDDDYHNYFWPDPLQPYAAQLTMDLYRAVGVDGVYCPPWDEPQWYAAAGTGGMVVWGGNLASVAGRAPVKDDRLVYPPKSPQWYDPFLRQRHWPQSQELIARFGASHVSLQDEGHQRQATSFDDWTLGQFRTALEARYRTLAALNAHWGTDFATWDDVRPAHIEDMQGADNFARWLEFRQFMDSQMADALGELANTIRDIPGAAHLPIGVEGIFGFSLHHVPYGLYDYAKLSQAGLDALSPYVSEFGQAPGGTAYDYDLMKGLGQKHMTTGWINPNMDPWEQLMIPWWGVFHGGNGTSYFIAHGYCSDMGAKLGRSVLIEDYTKPLREGVGKLLITADRHVDPVAVYFDMSNYTLAWAIAQTRPDHGWLNRLMADGRASQERLLQDLGMTPGYVTARQVERGQFGAYRAVILNGAICLSDAALSGLETYVRGGGIVIADGLTAIYDETGRPRDGQALERVFGVRRKELAVKLLPGQYSLGVLEHSDLLPSLTTEWMKASVLETGLEPTTATALGAHVELAVGPAFMLNRLGDGFTLYVNAVNTSYVNDADERDLNVWGQLLADAGVVPLVRVFKDDSPLCYYDVKPFRSGAALLAGVIRSPRYGAINPLNVDVRFPEAGVLYDVILGRALGKGRDAAVESLPGHPVLVARLPQAVTGIGLILPPECHRGDAPALRATVEPRQEVDTVLRVEVRRPDGAVSGALSGNVAAPRGVMETRLPIALDAMPGRWTVVVRDVMTGTTAKAAVDVR